MPAVHTQGTIRHPVHGSQNSFCYRCWWISHCTICIAVHKQIARLCSKMFATVPTARAVKNNTIFENDVSGACGYQVIWKWNINERICHLCGLLVISIPHLYWIGPYIPIVLPWGHFLLLLQMVANVILHDMRCSAHTDCPMFFEDICHSAVKKNHTLKFTSVHRRQPPVYKQIAATSLKESNINIYIYII